MENDNKWLIAVPVSQQEFLEQMQEMVRVISSNYDQILQILNNTPTKNDVYPYIDKKINQTEYNSNLNYVSQQLKDAYQQLNENHLTFDQKIQFQENQLSVFTQQSEQLVQFQDNYQNIISAIQNLHKSAENNQSQALQNLNSYIQEQNNIQTAFGDLNDQISEMQYYVEKTEDSQKVALNQISQIKQQLSQSVDSIDTAIKESNSKLLHIANQMPKIIQVAKIDLQQDIQTIVTGEQQRNIMEQNHYQQQLEAIQRKMAYLQQIQQNYKQSFAKQKEELLQELDNSLHNLAEKYSNRAKAQQQTLSKEQITLDKLVDKQNKLIKETTDFEINFNKADQQWKQQIASVQKMTEKYVEQIKENMSQKTVEINDYMAKSIQQSKITRQQNDQLQMVWEREWKERENLIDKQVKVVKDNTMQTKQYIEAEGKLRNQSIDQLKEKMNTLNKQYQKEVNNRARRDDVINALKTKIDSEVQ